MFLFYLIKNTIMSGWLKAEDGMTLIQHTPRFVIIGGTTVAAIVGGAVLVFPDQIHQILAYGQPVIDKGKEITAFVREYPIISMAFTAIVSWTANFALGKWRGRIASEAEMKALEDLDFSRTFTVSRSTINVSWQLEIKNTTETPISSFTRDMWPIGTEIYAKSKQCDEKTIIVPLETTGPLNESFIYDKIGQSLERQNNTSIDGILSEIERGADYVKDDQYGALFFEPQFQNAGNGTRTKTESKCRAVTFSAVTIAKAIQWCQKGTTDTGKSNIAKLCHEDTSMRSAYLDEFVKHMLDIPTDVSLDAHTKTDMSRRILLGDEKLPRPIDRKRFVALAHLLQQIFIEKRPYIKYTQYMEWEKIVPKERERIAIANTAIIDALAIKEVVK
jgi:hypothetical protein